MDGATCGPGLNASCDLNPLNDRLLLRPAVVQLPSVFHRIQSTSDPVNNGSDLSTMSNSGGSPSMSRKPRTIVSASGLGSASGSPTQSPYQSPKSKTRNCHHRHDQQREQQQRDQQQRDQQQRDQQLDQQKLDQQKREQQQRDQQQQQQQQKQHTTINGDVESPRQPHPRHHVSLMQQRVRTIVPKLTNDMQKGQCGRIGVFGGCIM